MRARFVDETPFGFGWIAEEPRFLERCSHAIVACEGVWIFDPVDCEEVEGRIRALGKPAGIGVLFERHRRDAATFGARLGVPVFMPHAPLENLPFQLVRIGRGELAAWFPEHETLLVSEALGTVRYMRAPGEPLGLHPWRRLLPPRRLNAFDPEHVLAGHGAGLHGPGTAEALHDVLDHGPSRTLAWLSAGFRAHLLHRR